MPIRAEGLRWLRQRDPGNHDPTHVSKHYPPEESWTNSAAWAFEVPIAEIIKDGQTAINLLCENPSDNGNFLWLKVPPQRLLMAQYEFRDDHQALALFISAEQDTLFLELRGNPQTSFHEYLQMET